MTRNDNTLPTIPIKAIIGVERNFVQNPHFGMLGNWTSVK
jgi:hypothetical protein